MSKVTDEGFRVDEPFAAVMESVRWNLEMITSGQVAGGNSFLTLRDPTHLGLDNLVSVVEMKITGRPEAGHPWAPRGRDQIELTLYRPGEGGKIPGWTPARSWTFESRKEASEHYMRMISLTVRGIAWRW